MPTVECPQCGTWLEVADQAACDPLQCPQCGESLLSDPDDTTRILPSPNNPDVTQQMPL
jgi:hypothetical protein